MENIYYPIKPEERKMLQKLMGRQVSYRKWLYIDRHDYEAPDVIAARGTLSDISYTIDGRLKSVTLVEKKHIADFNILCALGHRSPDIVLSYDNHRIIHADWQDEPSQRR